MLYPTKESFIPHVERILLENMFLHFRSDENPTREYWGDLGTMSRDNTLFCYINDISRRELGTRIVFEVHKDAFERHICENVPVEKALEWLKEEGMLLSYKEEQILCTTINNIGLRTARYIIDINRSGPSYKFEVEEDEENVSN